MRFAVLLTLAFGVLAAAAPVVPRSPDDYEDSVEAAKKDASADPISVALIS
jgi:hypothetical protein